MQLEVDREAGLAYLRRTDLPVAQTIEVSEAINVDIDETGRLIGVEVVDFTEFLDADALVSRFGLDQIEIGILRSLSA